MAGGHGFRALGAAGSRGIVTYWHARLAESDKAREYEALKARWIRDHPNATEKEFDEFVKWLAGWVKH